jgi:hypothetical protein
MHVCNHNGQNKYYKLQQKKDEKIACALNM